MAVTDYIITIVEADNSARFKVKYRNGKFNRLEHVYGKLSTERHQKLMLLCPYSEEDMPLDKYQSVRIEKVVKVATTHEQFIAKYSEWYEKRFGFLPIIKPMDAAALKFIKNSLIKLTGTDDEAIDMWDIILLNWEKQEAWYISQTELTQIKRNLNVILKTLKHGKYTEQTGRKATNVANDYRQKL